MMALLAGLVGKRAAGVIGRVLGFIVPVPVILILAALAWVHFDKSSAIRKAVDDKVTQMVAGAQIAALNAKISAQREIAAKSADAAAEALRRARAGQEAANRLEARLAATQAENEVINDDLADLLSRPVDRGCAVDADLLGRLRGR